MNIICSFLLSFFLFYRMPRNLFRFFSLWYKNIYYNSKINKSNRNVYYISKLQKCTGIYLSVDRILLCRTAHFDAAYIAVKVIWVMPRDIFSFIRYPSQHQVVLNGEYFHRWCLITRRKSRVSTKKSQQKQNSPLIKTPIRTTSRLTFLQYHLPG